MSDVGAKTGCEGQLHCSGFEVVLGHERPSETTYGTFNKSVCVCIPWSALHFTGLM